MSWTVLVLVLALQAPESDYRRMSWPDWDRDGLTTRHELLADRCAVLEADSRGRPLEVVCLDQYTLETIRGSSRLVDVEHVLAFRNVFFRIPERHWSRLREIYADTDNLVLTNRSLNRSKGAKSLAEFCPPAPEVREWLAWRVLKFAAKWSIDLSPDDRRGVEAWAAGRCAEG